MNRLHTIIHTAVYDTLRNRCECYGKYFHGDKLSQWERKPLNIAKNVCHQEYFIALFLLRDSREKRGCHSVRVKDTSSKLPLNLKSRTRRSSIQLGVRLASIERYADTKQSERDVLSSRRCSQQRERIWCQISIPAVCSFPPSVIFSYFLSLPLLVLSRSLSLLLSDGNSGC